MFSYYRRHYIVALPFTSLLTIAITITITLIVIVARKPTQTRIQLGTLEPPDQEKQTDSYVYMLSPANSYAP
jgi:hypothetical protein